jgi:hypothetical protein
MTIDHTANDRLFGKNLTVYGESKMTENTKLMSANYKQLAEDLYETLNNVSDFIDFDKFPLTIAEKLDRVLKKYEDETTRGTGRTTALYMKAITEALENPGKSVEFIDHYPHTWNGVSFHRERLEKIINKLGYDIVVQRRGQAQVFLYNKFVA